jgi:hypothetical protein
MGALKIRPNSTSLITQSFVDWQKFFLLADDHQIAEAGFSGHNLRTCPRALTSAPLVEPMADGVGTLVQPS